MLCLRKNPPHQRLRFQLNPATCDSERSREWSDSGSRDIDGKAGAERQGSERIKSLITMKRILFALTFISVPLLAAEVYKDFVDNKDGRRLVLALWIHDKRLDRLLARFDINPLPVSRRVVQSFFSKILYHFLRARQSYDQNEH